jgi:LytS/YehU family sensor histidine kinase
VERERTLIRESAEAQLKALRAQINPHFLFNALNTIVSLIEEHPEDAVEVVEHLSAIFRHILQTSGQPFVAVQDEFALVSHYLSIEQTRFGDRLQIEQHLDPDVQAHPVPAFAVQTLVENAVKHGLEVQRGGGTLRLSAGRRSDELVEIRVADTGVGLPALFDADERVVDTDAAFLGIGLRNVAARLEQLYGRNDLLRMQSAPGAGTTVRLLLPVVPTSEPADDARPTVVVP